MINESNTNQLNIETAKSVADDFKKYTLMCGDCFDGNSNLDLNRKLLHLSSQSESFNEKLILFLFLDSVGKFYCQDCKKILCKSCAKNEHSDHIHKLIDDCL